MENTFDGFEKRFNCPGALDATREAIRVMAKTEAVQAFNVADEGFALRAMADFGWAEERYRLCNEGVDVAVKIMEHHICSYITEIEHSLENLVGADVKIVRVKMDARMDDSRTLAHITLERFAKGLDCNKDVILDIFHAPMDHEVESRSQTKSPDQGGWDR